MGLEVEHGSRTVQGLIEGLEAHLAAHCVTYEKHAVIIVRQGDFEFRRLIGPHGPVAPPPWLSDGQLLAWHEARADLNEPAVQAIEQIIADAEAAGEQVVVCPPDPQEHAVRLGGQIVNRQS